MNLEQEWNVKIERYQLLEHLGSGGYGSVFLANYFIDEGLRVVKVLHQIGPDPQKRFEREIRILQERPNTNIVKVLDFGVTTQGHRYYAMEYCPLGDLRKLIGLVNSRFCLLLLDAMCVALEDCHSRGGFHRDIKPDNILIAREDGRTIFKLSDFGLAQDNNTSSVFTYGAAGTLGYLAPEVIAGEPYTSAADIYSLGVTIKELVAGGINKPLTQEQSGPLRSPIIRMLAQDPAKRPDRARLHQMVRTRLNTESNGQNDGVNMIVPVGRLQPEF